ncbi:MAG: ABC transporter ATP-binding protein [Spirochaetota bacterium]
MARNASQSPEHSRVKPADYPETDAFPERCMLELERLSKSFGGLKAISDLSFRVEQKSISAVIGPNGAGKTTLFNLISRLMEPDSGRVFFNSRRIDSLKPHIIPSLGIARTFQNLKVFSNMNVLENVMTGRYCRSSAGFFNCALHMRKFRREEKQIKEKAFYWLRFMKLEDLWNKNLNELPFEKQRMVEITRALASEPQLVLLDEPAAGLNVTETQNLADLIYRLQELGITLLIVEHDIDLIMEISDKIMVLNFGKKIAEGSAGEIREDRKVISVYLGEEFSR